MRHYHDFERFHPSNEYFSYSGKNLEKIQMVVNSLFAHQKLLGWTESMSSLEKVKHSYTNKDGTK